MNKPTAVNMTGSQTPYGVKHDNIEIGNVTNDYANNNGGLTWYNSPDTAGKYVIFSAANDNGFMTPTPLFWVCDQVDEDLITIVNGLPGRRGEIPFTNAIDAKDWLTSSPVYYLSEDTGGGGGGTGTWYFYSDEGNLNAGPPIGNGNTIFITSGQPIVETFNPNAAPGLKLLFNLNDSTGTDYTTQFTNQVGPGGKITITQNGNYAAYQYTVPGSIFIENGPAGTWAIIETSVALQAANASGPFNFNDPITLTFTL